MQQLVSSGAVWSQEVCNFKDKTELFFWSHQFCLCKISRCLCIQLLHKQNQKTANFLYLAQKQLHKQVKKLLFIIFMTSDMETFLKTFLSQLLV